MANEMDTPATILALLNVLVPALSTKAPGGATTIVVAGTGSPVTDVVTEL